VASLEAPALIWLLLDVEVEPDVPELELEAPDDDDCWPSLQPARSSRTARAAQGSVRIMNGDSFRG
jgi:hypothetical protein